MARHAVPRKVSLKEIITGGYYCVIELRVAIMTVTYDCSCLPFVCQAHKRVRARGGRGVHIGTIEVSCGVSILVRSTTSDMRLV